MLDHNHEARGRRSGDGQRWQRGRLRRWGGKEKELTGGARGSAREERGGDEIQRRKPEGKMYFR
jgi:hypothetical protein